MKSQNLTLLLVFSIFILLLVSFYYNDYFKEHFSDNKAPGIEVLTTVKAQKFQKPNDSEYLGFSKKDLKTLMISGEDYNGANPIIWNSLNTCYATTMSNRISVDLLIGEVFKSTKKSIEAMNKLKLSLPTPTKKED